MFMQYSVLTAVSCPQQMDVQYQVAGSNTTYNLSVRFYVGCPVVRVDGLTFSRQNGAGSRSRTTYT